MPTRAQYRLECRRLLHDATGKFWSNSELDDYITDARLRVCSDTGCLRRLLSSYLIQGVETYPIGALTGAVVTAGGSGYTSATVTVVGDGEGATATATLGTPTGTGGVTSLAVAHPGIYTSIPTLTFSSGAATAIARLSIATYSISGGSGNVVGDLITFTGGTFTTPLVIEVVGVNGGGGITGSIVIDGGDYSVLPSGGSGSTTTGAGVSVTFTSMAVGTLSSASVTDGASGYVVAPTVNIVGGGPIAAGSITAAISVGAPIDSITVTGAGERYTTATFVITGNGTGAAATPVFIPMDTLDILNITPIWGNQRIPLRYMPFTEFNARLRTFFINPQRPAVWSRYGTSGGTAYVQPVRDQNYVTEFDTARLPAVLEDDDEVDIIQYPYTSAVAYYACWKAKMKQQAFAESEVFLADYKRKVIEAQASVQMRRIPNPYYGYSGA